MRGRVLRTYIGEADNRELSVGDGGQAGAAGLYYHGEEQHEHEQEAGDGEVLKLHTVSPTSQALTHGTLTFIAHFMVSRGMPLPIFAVFSRDQGSEKVSYCRAHSQSTPHPGAC